MPMAPLGTDTLTSWGRLLSAGVVDAVQGTEEEEMAVLELMSQQQQQQQQQQPECSPTAGGECSLGGEAGVPAGLDQVFHAMQGLTPSPVKKRARFLADEGSVAASIGSSCSHAVADELRALWITKLMRAWEYQETRMGGGEGEKGLYGTIRPAGYLLLFQCLREHTGFGCSSRFLDAFGGTGRPSAVAAFYPGVASACMVEFDPIKICKATALKALVIERTFLAKSERAGGGFVMQAS